MCKRKTFILSLFKQKITLKVFGFRSAPHTPLNNLDLGFTQCPNMSNFYHGLVPVRQSHGHDTSCFIRGHLILGEVGFGKTMGQYRVGPCFCPSGYPKTNSPVIIAITLNPSSLLSLEAMARYMG